MAADLATLLRQLDTLEKSYPQWALDLRLCKNSISTLTGDRLEPRQAAVLAAISVGAQTIADICEELNMPRVNVFRTLRSLKEQGYIEHCRGQYGIIYSLL